MRAETSRDRTVLVFSKASKYSPVNFSIAAISTAVPVDVVGMLTGPRVALTRGVAGPDVVVNSRVALSVEGDAGKDGGWVGGEEVVLAVGFSEEIVGVEMKGALLVVPDGGATTVLGLNVVVGVAAADDCVAMLEFDAAVVSKVAEVSTDAANVVGGAAVVVGGTAVVTAGGAAVVVNGARPITKLLAIHAPDPEAGRGASIRYAAAGSELLPRTQVGRLPNVVKDTVQFQ